MSPRALLKRLSKHPHLKSRVRFLRKILLGV